MKFLALGSVVLCVALGWFAATQRSVVRRVEAQLAEASLQKAGLETRLKTSETDHQKLATTVQSYLRAAGQPCPADLQTCLETRVAQVTTKAGPNCSGAFADGVCPRWCAAGSDHDCCVQKGAGWTWIPGRGCWGP